MKLFFFLFFFPNDSSSFSFQFFSKELIQTHNYHISTLLLKDLRLKHGTTRDLSAKQTRELYHSLLPTNLLEVDYSDPEELFEAASKAIDIRNTAKKYSRERSHVHVLIFSLLFEFAKNSKKNNIDIWNKYADKLNINGFHLENAVNYPELCQLVLQKSCTTNQLVNNLVDFH